MTPRHLTRWRATCPYCGSQFARREYLHSGPRRCGACDARLKPAEPANTYGNLAFGVPLGLSVVAVLFYAQVVGAPTLKDKLIIAAVIALLFAVHLGVGFWAWPFITPFAPMPRQCWRCGYEMVGGVAAP